MLVKTKERVDSQIYTQSWSSYTVSTAWINLTTFTANSSWKLIITTELCVEYNSKSGEVWLDLSVNGTVVKSVAEDYRRAYYPNRYSNSMEYYVNEGDSCKLILRTTNSSNGAYAQNTKVVQEIYNFDIVHHNLTPTEIKEIWELLTCGLYWVFNNQYNGGIMLEKSNSATTWNITLWNAQWYIKVLFNWEYIKIPYYNE